MAARSIVDVLSYALILTKREMAYVSLKRAFIEAYKGIPMVRRSSSHRRISRRSGLALDPIADPANPRSGVGLAMSRIGGILAKMTTL